MLTEQVIIGTHRPSLESSSVSTAEPSIAAFDLHTYSQTASFKRSSTLKNCLAVTSSHLYAAQSDKAVVNVYNRAKQNLESTVPFQEKFTVIEASGGSGAFVAGGTESGRLTIWETTTGRFISTPQIHLQKVTCAAFNSNSDFIITGSADSNVHVWSLASLLNIRNSERKPERILDRHQREITAVLPGKIGTGGPTDILITASKDLSCIIWDYHTGAHLRTYIFSSVPTALALDPVDRAFYAGLEDGTVQAVDLYSSTGSDGQATDSTSHELFSEQFRDVPISLQRNRWSTTNHESPITSMGIVYEGNYLVTGNEKGDVNIWDIATGHVFRSLTQLKSSITSIKILSPDGFISKIPSSQALEQITVKKPRYDAVLDSASKTTNLDTYSLTTKFTDVIPETTSTSLALKTFTEISNFTPLSDMTTTMAAAADMKAFKSSLTLKHRTEVLESELATLYDYYDRLATLHRKTWDSHAKWLLGNNSSNASANSNIQDGSL